MSDDAATYVVGAVDPSYESSEGPTFRLEVGKEIPFTDLRTGPISLDEPDWRRFQFVYGHKPVARRDEAA